MIDIRNLVKDFGGSRALDGISFRVDEGDVFGFIGPNGAGKTTSMRILATLLDPTAGTATVGGHDVVDEPRAVRALVGFMPDAYGVYEGLSVREYLDFFASAMGLRLPRRDRAVEDVMALTDLGGLAGKPVSALSKGMRQRLCLAKTLVHDPRVLILDEPAAGLDPRARIEFRALLKELRRMGKTILISSHILTELSDLCNRIGIVEAGRMVATGTVEEILARIVPFPRVEVSVRDRAAEAVEAVRGLPFVRKAAADGLLVRVECATKDPDVPEIVRRLVSAGVPVQGVRIEGADLEDLFMKITEGKVQ
ncbi:MAG: ABC transporter ATP-binding protein [Planctomycetes bacterium]|nr:ABC transporter ATP-binding protein [Planctomycetota bacterium]